ncbi:hypothetical protein SAMN02745148_01531 [Modicisalibacter ilicicola DSM 19980]|uniref:Methyltransferase domain-containing protein n=1 Tax=Modicisalibacter ilicicola DSM 19980 TaxID=1121942 RepID=A0A1M4Y0A4_9GAMM|nr:hypothetical protein [Halomonas ilicicola]SHE99003.1 hypothetical protein SAMN02745148_01531 [Halomonas ilicicola DSM 19980]
MNQPAPGSTFDTQWLRLRQATDAKARDATLTRGAGRWLLRRQGGESGRVLSLVDLASGAGSNLEFLAARLPGPQRWHLIDHDAGLLDEATSRLRRLRDSDGTSIELTAHCRDLVTFDPDMLGGSDLVCASALFDLVSASWVERLAGACVARKSAVLFTLSVDGDWAFYDRDTRALNDAEDRWVRDQVNAHQRREKGFGEALGKTAPQVLHDAFSRRGYHVMSAPSPWRLPPGRPETLALGSQLLEGWATAVHEQAPGQRSRADAWLANRLTSLNDGSLGLSVGHVDLFARPREES